MTISKSSESNLPLEKNLRDGSSDSNEKKEEESSTSTSTSLIEEGVEEEGEEEQREGDEEEGSEETSSATEISSCKSNKYLLTEVLSPWRVAAKLHVEKCRAKCIREFGKDLHLHSDDSDTMIKLKEKITPNCAQATEKQEIQKKQRKETKSTTTAFDDWLRKKNTELKLEKMKKKTQQDIKDLKEAAKEAKQVKKRNENVEKWRINKEHSENEKRALEKIKEQRKSEKCNINDIMNTKMDKIPATEWEKIRQAAEDMQHIEPLKLGRLEGQGKSDPGEYLTKYVVKPDPAFKARYKHILEAAASRPTEIILDGDHNESVEDPAGLPLYFSQLLKEEAKKLRVMNSKKDKASKDKMADDNIIFKDNEAVESSGNFNGEHSFRSNVKTSKKYVSRKMRSSKKTNGIVAKKQLS